MVARTKTKPVEPAPPPPAPAAPEPREEQPWAADRVERWPLDRLVPYANNPNVHSPEQVEQIAASIRKFGWTIPVLVDEEGQIIAGHGRVMAAQKLGIPEVPVMTAVGWTAEKKRLYVIADNQIPRNSEWDLELLRVELTDLGEAGENLALTGFTEPQLLAFTLPAVEDVMREWGGMPGFNHEDKTAFRSLVVHFADQAAVDKFSELVAQNVTPSTRSIWYPKAAIETYVDKRYTAGSPAT